MSFLLSLMIAAMDPDAPIESRYPGATEVFYCNFDASWDQNFDGWPDRWRRQRGRGYPRYVTVKIGEEPSVAGVRCLRIDLDGGGAVAYSPDIPVGPLYSYVLEGWLKTEGLKHDRAYFSVSFLDKDRKRLQTFHSKKVLGIGEWTKYRLGPFAPRDESARLAVVGLHLEPGNRMDLKGAALFDDIWLGRLPRMAVTLNRDNQIYFTSDEIELTCRASGFVKKSPKVKFRVENELGQKVLEVERVLKTNESAASDALSLESLSDEPVGRVGLLTWKPRLPGPGFYRIRTTMRGKGTVLQQQESTLAVIEPSGNSGGGEFGWSLPDGDHPLPLPVLSRMVGQMGITWLKYPLWYGEDATDEQIEELINFIERMSSQGIEVVGMLSRPPASIRSHFGEAPSLKAADIFTTNSDLWYPSLEQVMMRLATRIQYWQLGRDKDTSFVGYLNLNPKIEHIKAKLDEVAQDVSLGIGWGWMDERPRAEGDKSPLTFLALSANPPLTHAELGTYLSANAKPRLARWASLEPLERERYSVEVRATDLVRRMVSAKINKAEVVFVPNPFHDDHGLLNEDGTPGELLLPWRTTALMLSGAKFLGRLELPQGSRNRVFTRGDEAVMLVWNEKPTQEILFLGEHARQVDLWGRAVTLPKRRQRQVVEVGPVPVFVVGLNEPITRWRMDCSFSRERIPSIFGCSHSNSCQMVNHFPRGAGGRAEIVPPEVWGIRPRTFTFQLADGEAFRHPFEIRLPYDASSGRQKIRVDFELQADELYRFSVYRHMDVGLGDVYIEITSQLNRRGELEVRQRLVNDTTARVSFNCQLFAPDRQRLRAQILGLGRGSDNKVYHFDNGRELVGKTLWLRAKELGGPRILNYRFTAEE